MAATEGTAVTIASGATTSPAFDLKLIGPDARIIGFVMPAAFTGNAITFQVSANDSTYQALYDNTNTQVSISVTQGRTYALKQDFQALLAFWRFIKIVSGSSEGGDRVITVVTK